MEDPDPTNSPLEPVFTITVHVVEQIYEIIWLGFFYYREYKCIFNLMYQ